MSWSFFETNNYLGTGAEESISWIPIIALIISLGSIFFTFIGIIISKKTEIKHQKFQDLCLIPVKTELSRVQGKLEENRNNLLITSLVDINSGSRDIARLLVAIRVIYPNINVDELHDFYVDFSDLCQGMETGTLTVDALDEFQILRVRILNEIYAYATSQLSIK